jgi:hypothetical protein
MPVVVAFERDQQVRDLLLDQNFLARLPKPLCATLSLGF